MTCNYLPCWLIAGITSVCLATHTETLVSASDYELVRVIDVAGRQGVATDGTNIYVSGSTSLYVYSRDGKLLKAKEKPFEDLEKPSNHIGDISVHDGELYAGIEWFEDGRGRDIQVAVYDVESLQYKRSIHWEPESGQVEVSAITVDAKNGLIWMTDWVNGNYISLDGSLYITADDGDAEDKEVDNLWKVSPDGKATAAYVTHELSFDAFRDVGEIEGLDFDSKNGELLVLANRGKRIVLGMPKGLYPGYDREIHEVYVFRIRK